jgi:hypothetical protein
MGTGVSSQVWSPERSMVIADFRFKISDFEISTFDLQSGKYQLAAVRVVSA